MMIITSCLHLLVLDSEPLGSLVPLALLPPPLSFSEKVSMMGFYDLRLISSKGCSISGPEGCNLFIYHLPQVLNQSTLNIFWHLILILMFTGVWWCWADADVLTIWKCHQLQGLRQWHHHHYHHDNNLDDHQVFIDRATNQSKCFGFVSFNNQSSAQAAIQVIIIIINFTNLWQ